MKDFIIIILISTVIVLLYFAVIGRFCHCSTVFCPSHDTLRSAIS